MPNTFVFKNPADELTTLVVDSVIRNTILDTARNLGRPLEDRYRNLNIAFCEDDAVPVGGIRVVMGIFSQTPEGRVAHEEALKKTLQGLGFDNPWVRCYDVIQAVGGLDVLMPGEKP